tara:strand:- start:38558 stop:38968 length:411 start_codon:yes stop_codon:yes gene_type:complete
MKPFDFLNSISYKKNYIMHSEVEEKEYIPFLTNRGLSYYPDTVLHANEMNMRTSIDNKLAYDYLINIVRPRKRFSKWHKAANNNEVSLITQYYNCSESKAEEYLKILSQSQLDIICNSVIKGQNEQSSREDGRNPS